MEEFEQKKQQLPEEKECQLVRGNYGQLWFSKLISHSEEILIPD